MMGLSQALCLVMSLGKGARLLFSNQIAWATAGTVVINSIVPGSMVLLICTEPEEFTEEKLEIDLSCYISFHDNFL